MIDRQLSNALHEIIKKHYAQYNPSGWDITHLRLPAHPDLTIYLSIYAITIDNQQLVQIDINYADRSTDMDFYSVQYPLTTIPLADPNFLAKLDAIIENTTTHPYLKDPNLPQRMQVLIESIRNGRNTARPIPR